MNMAKLEIKVPWVNKLDQALVTGLVWVLSRSSLRRTKAVVPTPQEESSGRVLLNTIISASKSLEACATQLEANAGLLEILRADSSSVNSLAAGVNYYASTTKAAHAAQSAHHKQVAWDWLSASNDKHPLKDALCSIRHHSECTSKAAYHLVETSKGILDELKSEPSQSEVLTHMSLVCMKL